MRRFRVALLGVTGVGEAYLAAISSDEQYELVAVGDVDRHVLARVSESCSAAVFDDYRSLIVETERDGIDHLFVALEPFESLEFVQMAADRGIGVFH